MKIIIKYSIIKTLLLLFKELVVYEIGRGYFMNIDINQLAEFFANNSFKVEGIFHYAQNPEIPYVEHTDSFPRFVFPLSGKTQFQFNGTPYIFHQERLYMVVQKWNLPKRCLVKQTGNIYLFYMR